MQNHLQYTCLVQDWFLAPSVVHARRLILQKVTCPVLVQAFKTGWMSYPWTCLSVSTMKMVWMIIL